MPDPSSSLADALLERCILLLEGGDQAGVDALLAEHAEMAPTLRERLAQLAALGILQPPREPSPIPERLGEFRLLRQIGRGGMGIVYLAEQTTLQRQVALKLVHPEQLFFRGARERFRREVLSIARLQHPGIVPILTCGEAEGIPFYAMDLVPGASLAEVLTQLAGTAPQALDGRNLRAALQRAMSEKKDLGAVDEAPVFQGSWANVCCRLVLDAAAALQHAHGNGVLHRDVKPSNLLLTSAGQVRVIDFGLASAEGEQRITRSGATMGSLPYMAPEQVRGDTTRIDARTDVYALGVTLYELLTLSLPHGDGGGRTRDAILAGHVEPPSRRNPLVHPDAEAVCLKAMDVDPGRRYQTVLEFAADLGAFLEQRTVRARRPSALLRVRRWARREPMRAAAALVAFMVLVPGPLLFAWQQHQATQRLQRALDDAERQRQAAETNLQTAEAEQKRAEFNLDQALEAVDVMLLRTAEARLADVPRTVKLRRQLLQDAVEFHQRLLAGTGTAPGNEHVRADRARAQVRLGALQSELGDLKAALPLLQEAVATLESLAQGTGPTRWYRLQLAHAQERLATLLGRTEHRAEEGAALRQAKALYEALASEGSGNSDGAVEGATQASLGLAINLGRLGRFAEAHALLDELDRSLSTDANAGTPLLSPAKLQLLRSYVSNNRGILLANAGDTHAALRSFEQSLACLDAPLADGAPDPDAALARVGLLERLGLLAHQRRQWDVAGPWLDRAAAEYERLLADEPEVVTWQVQFARVLGTRATNKRMLGDLAGAGADHDRAVELLTGAVHTAPQALQYRRALAVSLAERADARAQSGDDVGARRDFTACEAEFEQAIQLAPDDRQTRSNLVAALANHARGLCRLGDLASARLTSARALDLARQDTGMIAENNLIDLLSQDSDLAARDGDFGASLTLIEEADDRAQRFLQEHPEDNMRQCTAATVALNHGTTQLAMQDHPAAIRTWQHALPAGRAAAAVPYGRQILRLLLLRLADVHVRDGAKAEARRWFQEALEQTAATAAMVDGFEPLQNLFANPDLHDLLPEGHPDR